MNTNKFLRLRTANGFKAVSQTLIFQFLTVNFNGDRKKITFRGESEDLFSSTVIEKLQKITQIFVRVEISNYGLL